MRVPDKDYAEFSAFAIGVSQFIEKLNPTMKRVLKRGMGSIRSGTSTSREKVPPHEKKKRSVASLFGHTIFSFIP